MRVPNVCCWFLILSIGLGLSSIARGAPEDKEYIDDVKAKLARELEYLSSQNYRQANQQQIGAVERGRSKSFPLQLNAGTAYAIVAACDQDCTHVAIALRDSAGRLLVQSPEKDHTVIINGTPEQSSRHTAVVSVPGCKDDQCYVGLMVLHQAAAASSDPSTRAPAVAGALQMAAPQRFTSYDNYDLVGADIRPIKDIDLTGCASACEADGRCIAFSFDKWNRYCFLKEAANLFRLEPNTISGLRADHPKPVVASLPITMQRYRNKAFPSEAQQTRRADSFEECEQRCEQEPTCVAFTFFKDTKQCSLMATTGEYFANTRADSGVKRQEPER